MSCLTRFIPVCTLILLIQSRYSQKPYYDKTSCTSEAQVPGSNYLCNSEKSSCDTFIIYRSHPGYQSLSSLGSLFNTNESRLLSRNNFSGLDHTNLPPDHEIIIPVACRCANSFSQAIVTYNTSHSDTIYRIACEVFQGLAKARSVMDKNPRFEASNVPNNSIIQVPVRCACPNASESRFGTAFLVIYPIIVNDHINMIAGKFRVTEQRIRDTNGLDPFTTIFPNTTLLIPTEGVPVLNLDPANFPREPPRGSREIIPVRKVESGRNYKKMGVFLGGAVSVVIASMVIIGGIFIFVRKRNRFKSFQPLPARSSQRSNLSPDFLDGMSKLKHTLISFSLEKLSIATANFNEESRIGSAVYKGRTGDTIIAVQQVNSAEAAHQMIRILTKINHLNVVKLEGCCYNPKPYLVYEFAEKGSLKDCLINPKKAKQFTWTKRLQVALDLAVGLHYIHYCTKPNYVHRNLNSRNVLITMDWRAKISGFKFAKSLISKEEKEDNYWIETAIVGRKGYLAPEYLAFGQASTKVDVYAFGVILLELISATEPISDGKFLKDLVRFLSSESLPRFFRVLGEVKELHGSCPKRRLSSGRCCV